MKSERIIVFRFSSFGDVLITIPVITSFLREYPEIEIVFFTRSVFAPYYPKNDKLKVIGLDLDKEYRGIRGLFRLYLEVKNQLTRRDSIIDLHSVLRTNLLCLFFRLQGNNVYKIDKPRRARKKYIRGKRDIEIPKVSELYRDTFIRAGYSFKLNPPPFYRLDNKKLNSDVRSEKRIGIAPFSKHLTKTWPFQSIIATIQLLNERIPAKFFLLASKEERILIGETHKGYFQDFAKNPLPDDEIELISSLDLVISMDSANMHLADILGVPVISIWGGTDPKIGFAPSYQNPSLLITPPELLNCRPCSVYGTDNCKLSGDQYRCLTTITPEIVVDKVLAKLQ